MGNFNVAFICYIFSLLLLPLATLETNVFFREIEKHVVYLGHHPYSMTHLAFRFKHPITGDDTAKKKVQDFF